MNRIELEKWEVIPGSPRRLKYIGQPTAQEVFAELRHRLEGMGYLPDEYFLMEKGWENGREIPKGADIFCEVDYGESEGIYLDGYLKWLKGDITATEPFFTGKTLGDTGNDLDRMFLISSAITKAFHGENSLCYSDRKYKGHDDTGGALLHLSMQEQEVLVRALAEQRERQETAISQTEQLLRRMTGSITEYISLTGQRPLHMSDSDKAVLAIRDGNLREFKELLPRITGQETIDMLFLEAAARPGEVGRKMTLLLMEDSVFSENVYRQACEKAVYIMDEEKVALLQEQASAHTDNLPPDFFGKLAQYAYTWPGVQFISAQIIERCSPEEVSATPEGLLKVALLGGDMDLPRIMARKGVNGDSRLRTFIQRRGNEGPEKLRELLQLGMKVSPDNYDALAACVEYQCPEAGKLLIDHGVDFEVFASQVKGQDGITGSDAYTELAEYWQERQQQEPGQEQTM